MSSYKEIAARAGVSIGTVYRVLHDRGRYSRRTAERVRTVARELGYRKNIYASNLSRSRSYEIGVLMPEPSHDNTYWAQPHQGIVSAVEALEHYRVGRKDFFYDEHSGGSFSSALHRLVDSGVDAAIIAPTRAAQDEPLITRGGLAVPHVLIDSVIPSPRRLGFVGQDSYASGRAAGRLLDLISPREKEIVLVRSTPASRHIDLRMSGARDYLTAARGGPAREIDVDFSDEADTTRRLTALPAGERIGAWFVSNSNAAILARLLRDPGASPVPVVGYDLVPTNAEALREGSISFLLTQRPHEQGRLAVEMIHRALILGERSGGDRYIPIDIVTAETLSGHLLHEERLETGLPRE